jgi:hypothetical protein
MTKEEIGDLVAALPQGLDSDEFIYRLVNWAVDIEREACAKACEGLKEEFASGDCYGDGTTDCAEAIRARGET